MWYKIKACSCTITVWSTICIDGRLKTCLSTFSKHSMRFCVNKSVTLECTDRHKIFLLSTYLVQISAVCCTIYVCITVGYNLILSCFLPLTWFIFVSLILRTKCIISVCVCVKFSLIKNDKKMYIYILCKNLVRCRQIIWWRYNFLAHLVPEGKIALFMLVINNEFTLKCLFLYINDGVTYFCLSKKIFGKIIK